MIRFYLLVLLTLALGAAAAWYLRADSGYVLVSWRRWVLETSVVGFVTALIAGGLALYYGAKLAIVTLRLPQILRGARDRRRGDRARRSFETGLIEYLEGNFKRAEIELVRRAADHPAPHLSYLLAARAAQKQGDTERRDQYLKLAREHSSSAEFAAMLSQAELLAERGNWAGAGETLRSLRARDARHPYLIDFMARLHEQAGEWQELRTLLASADAQKALPAERYRALMLHSLQALLAATLAGGRLDEFKRFWGAIPSSYRDERVLRNTYVRGLLRLNAEAEALALIATTLRHEWDPELARLYGEQQGGDPMSQLASIEQWLSQYGEKPELLWVAGRACLRNRLWGKARSYLEAAAKRAPQPGIYLDLARLCQETQSPEDAAKFYKRGLELAAATA